MKPLQRRLIEKKLKENLKLRKELNKKLRGHRTQIERLNASKKRIQSLITDLEDFKNGNEGYALHMEKAPFTPDKATGIWLVKERTGKNVKLVKFFDFVKFDNEKQQLKLSLNLPSDKPMFGSDNLEVTFAKGDLLSCAYINDLKADAKEGMAFNFANVMPSNAAGLAQYDYALGKLGIKQPTTLATEYLVVDGNFRKVN